VDNEACLEWLESALQEAFEQRKPELWVYLEAVMEEVHFEIEAQLPSPPATKVPNRS
jgi:hypothetical protein